jgi:hypothetical protein
MTTVNITTTTNTVDVTTETGTAVVQVPVTSTVTAITEGPQGPSGTAAGGLPTGGDPGSILLKNTNANYDSVWAANLDGGTFN